MIFWEKIQTFPKHFLETFRKYQIYWSISTKKNLSFVLIINNDVKKIKETTQPVQMQWLGSRIKNGKDYNNKQFRRLGDPCFIECKKTYHKNINCDRLSGCEIRNRSGAHICLLLIRSTWFTSIHLWRSPFPNIETSSKSILSLELSQACQQLTTFLSWWKVVDTVGSLIG